VQRCRDDVGSGTVRSWLQELAASQEPDAGLMSRRAATTAMISRRPILRTKEEQAILAGIADMWKVIAENERSLDSTMTERIRPMLKTL
jgi:hypothetical protein